MEEAETLYVNGSPLRLEARGYAIVSICIPYLLQALCHAGDREEGKGKRARH
jgi:hypothetical protein